MLGKAAGDFFKVSRQDNVDEVLEAVVDGKAKAGVVTKSNLAVYEDASPAASAGCR